MLTTTPADIVEFIRAKFANPTARVDQNSHPDVAALAALLRALPDSATVLAPAERSTLIASIGQIDAIVATWESGLLDARQKSFFSTPIHECLRVLANCPATAPSPSTPRVAFVHHQTLRQDLELDITAVEAALAASSWKVVVVLAGSVIEALLVDELRRIEIADRVRTDTARTAAENSARSAGRAIHFYRGPFEEMKFFALIDVATAARCLDAELEKLADIARNFRNLIHPGATVRGDRPDRGAALQTAGVMFSVIAHLEREHQARIFQASTVP